MNIDELELVTASKHLSNSVEISEFTCILSGKHVLGDLNITTYEGWVRENESSCRYLLDDSTMMSLRYFYI